MAPSILLLRGLEREGRSRSGLPPGTYTYHAWRPGGQPLTGSISVDGTTPLKSVGHNHPRTVRLCGRAARDSPARAQATIAAEFDMTAGYSGEDVRATATQLRLFGKAPGKVDFFTEVAWGDRWPAMRLLSAGSSGVDPTGTDVFAAYPYGGRTVLMEMPRALLPSARSGARGAPADSACPSASTAAATTATPDSPPAADPL